RAITRQLAPCGWMWRRPWFICRVAIPSRFTSVWGRLSDAAVADHCEVDGLGTWWIGAGLAAAFLYAAGSGAGGRCGSPSERRDSACGRPVRLVPQPFARDAP